MESKVNYTNNDLHLSEVQNSVISENLISNNRIDKLELALSSFIFQIKEIMSSQISEIRAVVDSNTKKIDHLFTQSLIRTKMDNSNNIQNRTNKQFKFNKLNVNSIVANKRRFNLINFIKINKIDTHFKKNYTQLPRNN